MKLYTKRGDRGLTDLFGGGRVPKDHLRVEAYGTVDELNAAVGLAAVRLEAAGEGLSLIAGPLGSIQRRLFEIGADLATPKRDGKGGRMVPRIGPEHIAEIEGWIDTVDAAVPAMTSFILPGGTELSARLHLARTICRRAERCCVSLGRVEEQDDVDEDHQGDEPPTGVYLNRLSDLLFAMARYANHAAGVADVPWTAPTG
ncbi:cob(I)yrinic acid a,c-diamide adenosyltransferase [Phycisphaera mikurensis]|uniref:Corrinoid adenosyltransferase n=1 Tax=Phycisphaera mikurensis (strain NBRC 102666 / KCTC 22515 / FYK2301M01) TaxID=1142394 RepID=I0IHI2_PHYMF|nr:cob(I)yrinic acid a,c-diamide adenosyltransferase [Phycisphaera mikurensis]MBB6440966.1 cob(I)alamin adenosyltransferase [Phycisphaera mikurensis]BAM04720.1 cob(I)alamin adenosyltransferase [Phycisphaera mikurensis NBRC 102666]